MRLSTLGAVGLALGLALPAPAGGEIVVERSRRLSVPFRTEGRLSFNAHAAELSLQGWSRDEVRVDATKRVDGLDPALESLSEQILEQIVVRLEHEGDRIDLLVSYPPHCRLELDCSVKLSVFAPHRLSFVARYDDADLRVADLHGGLELQNDAGDIRLDNVSGRIGVHTRSGNVSAVIARSAHVSIVADEGDISVTVPDDATTEPVVLVRASAERVRADGPVWTTRESYEQALQSGTLRGGGWPRVELYAGSGRIEIRRAGKR